MASVILADCIGFVEIYGEFAADFRKTGASCRVDVGIDPYNARGKGSTLNKGEPWGRSRASYRYGRISLTS